MVDSLQILKEHNIKGTKYRMAILELLIKEEYRFISIDEIQDRISSDFSTAYRALELFEENEMIYRTKINEKMYYSYRCNNKEYHHHLICTECGLKVSLDFCPFEDLEKKCTTLGFESFHHSRDLFGICKKCKNES